MKVLDITYFMAVVAPIFIALTCAVLVGMVACNVKMKSNIACKPVIGFFICIIINWLALTFYHYNPNTSVYFYPLFFLTILLEPICFYHFVFILTRDDKNKKFPYFYYIFPIVLFLTFAIWSLFIPKEAAIELIRRQGQPIEMYSAYSHFFNSITYIRGFVSLYFMSLVLVRLFRFKKKILNYSSDEDKGSLRWVNSLTLITIAILIIPIGIAIFNGNRTEFFSSPFLILMVILTGFQLITLAYNVINNNFILLPEEEVNENEVSAMEGVEKPSSEDQVYLINKKEFEDFMHNQKPYLNPNLKITDLTKPLNTNRTYLSSFINQTYEMNFCRFVNTCRLKELQILESDPEFQHYNKTELAGKAGFSTYQNYLRAKKREDSFESKN